MMSNCKGLVHRFKILGSVHEWESYLAQNASLLSITAPPHPYTELSKASKNGAAEFWTATS